jgi:hypothetical protein
MITKNELRNLLGAAAHDPAGEKLGKIGQVSYDDDTDQPKWVTVHTGLFGASRSAHRSPCRRPTSTTRTGTGRAVPEERRHAPFRA